MLSKKVRDISVSNRHIRFKLDTTACLTRLPGLSVQTISYSVNTRHAKKTDIIQNQVWHKFPTTYSPFRPVSIFISQDSYSCTKNNHVLDKSHLPIWHSTTCSTKNTWLILIPYLFQKSLADCMKNFLIDSLIGYQGNWSSDKASKLSSTYLSSWNSGMSQWYVTYRSWQKPQARPTIPNLLLTCSEDAKLFLNGSMIFPWSVLFWNFQSEFLMSPHDISLFL